MFSSLADATGVILAESHFNSGAEGWTQNIEGQAGFDVNFDAMGGVSGGGIRTAKDVDWFSAPLPFLGDKSSAYGGSIRFSLKQNKTSSMLLSAVRIESEGLMIGRTLGKAPPRAFESLEFHLDENSGWFNIATGNLATRDEMLAALKGVQSLRIRANYTAAGDDVASLDDVVLSAAPDAPSIRMDTGKLLTLSGTPGETYEIQFASEPNGAPDWKPLLAITLPDSPNPFVTVRLFDAPTGQTNQFFRAVLVH